MKKKQLTATHSKILDILTWKDFGFKHINYVSKCTGYDYETLTGLATVYGLLTDLRNRRLVIMDRMFIDRPEDTNWKITDKGKDYLSNL